MVLLSIEQLVMWIPELVWMGWFGACVHPSHKPKTNFLSWNHSVYWLNSADSSVIIIIIMIMIMSTLSTVLTSQHNLINHYKNIKRKVFSWSLSVLVPHSFAYFCNSFAWLWPFWQKNVAYFCKNRVVSITKVTMFDWYVHVVT